MKKNDYGLVRVCQSGLNIENSMLMLEKNAIFGLNMKTNAFSVVFLLWMCICLISVKTLHNL